MAWVGYIELIGELAPIDDHEFIDRLLGLELQQVVYGGLDELFSGMFLRVNHSELD